MQIYAFSNTILLVNGVEILGWDEGDDVIGIKRRNPSITDKVGVGGDMAVSVSSDKSGEVTIKLQQTSPSNAFLQRLMDAQESGGLAFEPLSVRFQDLLRQDVASGTVGYIAKPSDMMRGGKTNVQEWTFVLERLDMSLGSPLDVVAIF